jgi:hypothetical protein
MGRGVRILLGGVLKEMMHFAGVLKGERLWCVEDSDIGDGNKMWLLTEKPESAFIFTGVHIHSLKVELFFYGNLVWAKLEASVVFDLWKNYHPQDSFIRLKFHFCHCVKSSKSIFRNFFELLILFSTAKKKFGAWGERTFRTCGGDK